jgi:hypothetical protein
MEMPMSELRGSTPVMTAKELLLELWADMKIVRPIAEELRDADILTRVQALEQVERNRVAAQIERGRIGAITNKTIVAVVLVSNFLLGFTVMVVNILQSGAQ